MKNKTNSKIIRIPLDKGKFSTISNNILMNTTLSSDAKVLLHLLLNNTEEWNVNLQFYSDRFKWNGQKQARVIKELKDNGFLSISKYSKGNKAGFDYYFTISEYGNLKHTEEQTSQPTTEIKEAAPTVTIIPNDKESIELYLVNVANLLDEYGKSFTISTDLRSEILDLFKSFLVDDNTLDATQFNEPAVRKYLLNYIIEGKIEWIKFIIEKDSIKLHGSQANQKKFINETPKYFKQLFESGRCLTDDEIRVKLSNQKYSILGSGAKNLPDAMD